MEGAMADTGQLKVTYATLAAGQTEEFHRAYDEALARARAALGATHPNLIAGQALPGASTFADVSPADTRLVLGHFAAGTREDARRAIAAAREAFPRWRARPWQERVALLRRAADLIVEGQFELAALMTLEAGKNRLEAMGDVTEAADLIRYYCQQMEEHDGFARPMASLSPAERNRSVLRPYGVWVVISPFNFPLALAAGPAGGALVAGNTVVFKPSSDCPFLGLRLGEILNEAGLPAGVFNYVAGPGGTVGEELVENPGVDGLLFTGSKEVGFAIYRRFSKAYPKPCITEMGGKNPAIVTARADLDEAAEGVVRAAFGFGGQKCSACARVYVERAVKEPFNTLLAGKTRGLAIGDPADRATFLGPLINERAYKSYQRYVEIARRDGTILHGGRVRTDPPLQHGFFVEPTIVDGLPKEHLLFTEELFVPIVCLATVDTFDEALDWANRTEYGLTAGLYSEDQAEIDRFLDQIQAGVVYVNRRAGATTGAWPGSQPFGGWKGSGSTGKASGGRYYVQQFLREQSQTIIE
jgi:1-pyrroline-5-carboxylate dehydrogenase